MVRYIVKRLVVAVITLFVIISITWFIVRFLPGTPFNDVKLTGSAKANLYAKYGLDKPLPVQYLKYLYAMLHGDLGVSYYFDNTPVTQILAHRVPVSGFLGFQAIVFGGVIGLPLGVAAALRHNKVTDNISTAVAVLGVSIPNFVVAALLQYVVGLKFGILPIAYWNSYRYSLMPSFALSVFVIATVARFMRTEMLEVLDQDYITLARSKGLRNSGIVVRHVLRNSMTPMITVIFPLVVSVVTGSLVVEQIFSVPGIGEEFVRSAEVNDYSMILGVTILYAVLFVIARLVQDILYGIADPRIRLVTGEA